VIKSERRSVANTIPDRMSMMARIVTCVPLAECLKRLAAERSLAETVAANGQMAHRQIG
jgi:hypothetical protein